MIWLNFAFRTENFITSFFRASHSKFSFVFCCFFRNLLPVLILFVIVDISSFNLPNISTSAKHYSWNICELSFILYSIEFRSHNFSELKVSDLGFTEFIRTVDLFMFWQVFSRNYFAAFVANYVRAFVDDCDLVHRHFIKGLFALYTLHSDFFLHFLFKPKPFFFQLLVKSVFKESCN